MNPYSRHSWSYFANQSGHCWIFCALWFYLPLAASSKCFQDYSKTVLNILFSPFKIWKHCQLFLVKKREWDSGWENEVKFIFFLCIWCKKYRDLKNETEMVWSLPSFFFSCIGQQFSNKMSVLNHGIALICFINW